MATRKPKPRASYRHDAQFLLRLAHAVESDGTRDFNWRSGTVELINTLAYRLLEDSGGKETQGQGERSHTQEEGLEAIIIPEERDPVDG